MSDLIKDGIARSRFVYILKNGQKIGGTSDSTEEQLRDELMYIHRLPNNDKDYHKVRSITTMIKDPRTNQEVPDYGETIFVLVNEVISIITCDLLQEVPKHLISVPRDGRH